MKFWSTILLLLMSMCIYGQQCAPLEGLSLDLPSIYPAPSGVIPPEAGGLGITDDAYIGEHFSYTFTVMSPSSYINPITNSETFADSTIIYPDSIYTEFNGVRTLGLPAGLSMDCAPEKCIFLPNDEGPSGCFAISGTPDASLVPGDYKLILSTLNCLSIPSLGQAGCFAAEVPGAVSMIFGEYSLTINPARVSSCMLDEEVSTEFPAFFPLPFGVIPVENGGIGITDTAYIGEAFNYDFTVIFPANFLETNTNTQANGDSILIQADSVLVTFEGTQSVGLPSGLSLLTSSPGQYFRATNDGPAGCFSIEGTPGSNVAPGDYNIVFVSNNCLKIETLGFDGCNRAEIPSAFTGILGVYNLTIANRTTSINERTYESEALSVFPNPASNELRLVSSELDFSGDARLLIHSIDGTKHYSRTWNTYQNIDFRLDVSNYANGIYFYTLELERKVYTGKFLVSHKK